MLADLCGPKIRVGRFPGGRLDLAAGEQVTVTTRDVTGGPGLIPSQYAELPGDVRPGDRILLDDGMIELRVLAIAGSEVSCTVLNGGVLKDRKGMNLPGVPVSAPALTDKDRADARFALDLGVDYLALSFVRSPADVAGLKELIAAEGSATPVIAKIEKPEGDRLHRRNFLTWPTALLVARGDLGAGSKLAPEFVPIVQQELVTRARQKGKPVIVATQMLESMIEHPRPTRAEVSDVSHAVFAGADAVMLSAETASGAYPVKAVEMMDRVARQVEGWQWMEGASGSITRARTGTAAALAGAICGARRSVAPSVARLARARRHRRENHRWNFGLGGVGDPASRSGGMLDDGCGDLPANEPAMGRGAAPHRILRFRASGWHRTTTGSRPGPGRGRADDLTPCRLRQA